MAEIQRERVSVKETAEILGISEQAVREQMKANALPIGDVIRNSSGTRYRYWIYKDKLYRHIGKIPPETDIEQVREMLEGLLGRLMVLTET